MSEDETFKIGVGVGKGSSGVYALKWTIDNELPPSRTIYLIHVYPPLRLIPTPMGNKVPVSEVNEAIVRRFQEERFKETEALVEKYRKICQMKQVKPEVCYVVGDSIQQELVDQVFKLGLTKLVLGTSTNTVFSRAFRGETIAKFVAKQAPHFCTVLVVCKGKLLSAKEATESLTPASSDTASISSEGSSRREFESPRSSTSISEIRQSISLPHPRHSSDQRSLTSLDRAQTTPRHRNESALSEDFFTCNSIMETEMDADDPSAEEIDPFMYPDMLARNVSERSAQSMSETNTILPAMSDSMPTSRYRGSFAHRDHDLEADGDGAYGEEVLQHQFEETESPAVRPQEDLEAQEPAEPVQHTEQIVEMAKKLIEENVRERDEALRRADLAKNKSLQDALKLKEVTSQLRTILREHNRLQKDLADEVARHRETQRALEESRCRIEEYRSSLESAKKQAEEERERCEEAMGRLREALEGLEEEKRLRREAEEIARKETATLRRLQRTYTVYSFEDLAMATDNFSERNKIGEGGYGPVYKGELQHTTVAIKLLAHDGERGRQEFEREVELLSTFHHPHMVMLLGACPEKACIVYEFMPNGSLQDRLECKGGTPPLPWYVRFKICAEVAVALLFLHSRPEPIVHRDLKPGNILLDRNFVGKISDVGIAKLVPDTVTSTVTMYKETVLMGTFAYMDPDYHRTGIVTRESDVYALGIIMLQLLTGKPAVGVSDSVEQAIVKDYLYDILDRSAGDWPIEKATDFALLALECSDPRRRNRPKLETRILPALENLRAYAAEAQLAAMASPSHSSEIVVPDFLLCPISQEIMQNPHIAADGFTYDYESISHWLKDHNSSPMTNLPLEHKNLIPNLAVRSAVQSWYERMQS